MQRNDGCVENRTRYLVIGYSRSGTTAIHLGLVGHPETSALDGELRPLPFFSKGAAAFTGGHLHDEEKQVSHRVLFDALASMRNPDAQVLGAKTACNSPKEAQVIVDQLLKHLPTIKIVHVVRRDVIAHFGSVYSARKSGVFHSWDAKRDAKEKKEVALPRWQLMQFIRATRRLNSVLDKLQTNHDYLRVSQEDLLANPDDTYKSLFEFVGVDASVPVTWQSAKKVLPDARAYISNYDQCARWSAQSDSKSNILLTRLFGFLRRYTQRPWSRQNGG